jgi:pseudaminic acid biosynthesis-associated methylase
MENFKTEQENFWSGEFGDEYIDRNKDAELIASCTKMFGDIFSKCTEIKSVLELGANRGNNLIAIKNILPPATELSGIEINKNAVNELKRINGVTAYHSSILDFKFEKKVDFVFTRGVLIHINPDELTHVYEKMYSVSSKYICVAEYYNPSPVTIKYRGHDNRLFKRDFAGDLLEKYSDLKLVDYGFVYHRDSMFAQDDITWFLMKKKV